MKSRVLSVLFSTAVTFLTVVCLGGCSGEERPENVLARVDDSAITVDDFRREWANQPAPPPGVPPESVERFLDDMIAERLFVAEARRRKLDQNEVLRREVERYREQLLVEELLSREVLTVSDPSPAEVEEFWAAHRKEFFVPELTRLSHILIRVGEGESADAAIERCRMIKDRLEGGEDFAVVAREVSEGSGAERGGDLGYFREEQIIPEFQAAAGELETGEVGGPIKTEYGYHLLTVTEVKPPREKTLEESRAEISAILLAEKRKERFEAVRSAIAASVSVEKNRDLIERLQADQDRAFSQPGVAEPGAR